MARWFLRSDVQIQVMYDDRTPLGSPVSSRTDDLIRSVFAEFLEDLERRGPRDFDWIHEALRNLVRSNAFLALAEGQNDRGWTLRPELLYPPVEWAPARALAVLRPEADIQATVELPQELWAAAHDLLARLSSGGVACPGQAVEIPEMGQLLQALIEGGLVEALESPPWERIDRELEEADFTFLGHNTALVHSSTTCLLVDPLLFPQSTANPGSYQPLQVGQLPPIDGVLITHSHPDHFDPGALLRLPPDVPVVVPVCDRETVLAVHMSKRLLDLGFRHVHQLRVGARS